MKKLLSLLLIISFWTCSNSPSAQSLDREEAMGKVNEAIAIYVNSFLNNYKDSVVFALNLLDESIAMDTTYLLAYEHKKRILNAQGRYSEALDVIELMLRRASDKQMPDIFLLRGIQHDKLGQPELAELDYQKSVVLFDKKIQQNPNDVVVLSGKAIALFFSKDGREAGISIFEDILSNKTWTDIEHAQYEMVLDGLKTDSREKIISEQFN
jgi:tetratricopeptide (TPR) repeat protein